MAHTQGDTKEATCPQAAAEVNGRAVKTRGRKHRRGGGGGGAVPGGSHVAKEDCQKEEGGNRET